MIIFWRGWGILVLLAGFVAFMLAAFIVQTMNIEPTLVGVVYTAIFSAAGLALWLFAEHVERGMGEADKLPEQARGETGDAGSFFFVPTRTWAFILPGIAVLGDIVTTLNPNALH